MKDERRGKSKEVRRVEMYVLKGSIIVTVVEPSTVLVPALCVCVFF